MKAILTHVKNPEIRNFPPFGSIIRREKPVYDLPCAMLAVILWMYWSQVVIRAALYRRRYRKSPGLLPKKLSERILWPMWAPLVVGWCLLPVLALTSRQPLFMLPEGVQSHPALFMLRCVAAGLAAGCYLLTVHCWRRMGRSWSLAVVPRAKTELVRTGLYASIRHPIYALSIVLMVASVIVVPIWPMFLLATLHVFFMILKARGEERSLLAALGPVYAEYRRRTGAFFPRISRCLTDDPRLDYNK